MKATKSFVKRLVQQLADEDCIWIAESEEIESLILKFLRAEEAKTREKKQ